MAAFKDNLEEQRQRSDYRKGNFWSIFFLSIIIGFAVIYIFGFYKVHWVAVFIYVPNTGETFPFYALAAASILYFRWWWHGLPPYFMFLLGLARKIISKPYAILLKHKSFKDFMDKNLPSKITIEKIKIGKKEQLQRLIYQKANMSDELPRAKKFTYFSSKRFSLSNIFDYKIYELKAEREARLKKTGKSGLAILKDSRGTQRMMSYFRDHRTELYKKKASNRKDIKVAEKAKKALENRTARFHDKKIPTIEQEKLFLDLFYVIEGMIEGYAGKTDWVRNVEMDSPLNILMEDGSISGLSVDSNIDVYKEGKVYFSLNMLAMTTAKMTFLYMNFLVTSYERQSRISTGKISEILSDENNFRIFEDFFKIVFFRRLLLNYGSVPSGWMCGRIESYDLRAIMSAVDRPMIPTITSNNDGSNNLFSSDVVASSFLFTYWAFIRNEKIAPIIDDLDWCFNTTKDLNEIKAREASRQAAKEIEEMEDKA